MNLYVEDHLFPSRMGIFAETRCFKWVFLLKCSDLIFPNVGLHYCLWWVYYIIRLKMDFVLRNNGMNWTWLNRSYYCGGRLAVKWRCPIMLHNKQWDSVATYPLVVQDASHVKKRIFLNLNSTMMMLIVHSDITKLTSSL